MHIVLHDEVMWGIIIFFHTVRADGNPASLSINPVSPVHLPANPELPFRVEAVIHLSKTSMV